MSGRERSPEPEVSPTEVSEGHTTPPPTVTAEPTRQAPAPGSPTVCPPSPTSPANPPSEEEEVPTEVYYAWRRSCPRRTRTEQEGKMEVDKPEEEGKSLDNPGVLFSNRRCQSLDKPQVLISHKGCQVI
eukprot:Skav232519  [mRNA]  locus=scaffold1096:875419:875805:+ [translate_table: standard]